MTFFFSFISSLGTIIWLYFLFPQDILKFGAVFMVVFCAFMVGLHNLYWYYPKDVRKHVELVENNVTTEAEQHFGM